MPVLRQVFVQFGCGDGPAAVRVSFLKLGLVVGHVGGKQIKKKKKRKVKKRKKRKK